MYELERIDKLLLSMSKSQEWRARRRVIIEESKEFQLLLERQIKDTLEIQIREEIVKIKLDRDYLSSIGILDRVYRRIEGDLDVSTQRLEAGNTSLREYIEHYGQATNRKLWPCVILLLADGDFDQHSQAILSLGLEPVAIKHMENEAAEALRIFGAMAVRIPPEQKVLGSLAGEPGVSFIFDGEAEVGVPDPPLGEEGGTESVGARLDASVPIVFPEDEPLPPDFPAARGKGVQVAVVDTGIDTKHPDLEGRVEKAVSFIENEGPEDVCGHGTHVAGIIAGSGRASGGRFAGIAPACSLLSVKVLNNEGTGTTLSVLAGIRWCIDHKVDVINMSLGGQGHTDGLSLLSRAVDEAARRGILVAVAAGNSGPEAGTIEIPADAREGVCVGATTKGLRVARFSSRGPTDDPARTGQKPDLVAPGCAIVSARSSASSLPPIGGNSDYSRLSGTSMATPHVAGAAAVLLGYLKEIRKGRARDGAALVRKALKKTSRRLEGYSTGDQGHGLINVPKAAAQIYEKVGQDRRSEERKKEVGAVLLGARPSESGDFRSTSMFLALTKDNKKVYYDALFPHVVFICGKRGSGKSYTLGVLAEELASMDLGIGVVLVDPIGVFWSMKMPNDEKADVEAMREIGLEPKGMTNAMVLVPFGNYREYEDLADGSFSISTKDMKADDWCALFDIDRFGAQGLLIDRAIQLVKDGYTAREGGGEYEVAPRESYDISHIIQCVSRSRDLCSGEEGFALSTRRSVIARLMTAEQWGVFSEQGTKLSDISRSGRVTIIDVSHPDLGDSIAALVAGVLARNIYYARKKITRLEEAGLSVGEEENVPVTWLLIDEAHSIVPRGRHTVATAPIITYAKQGRKPGCALVLATQQPAATDDEIISQADFVLAHTLAFQDDILALVRRIPAHVPFDIREPDFIRSLAIGEALLADQKTQTEAFITRIRPRVSMHAGKVARPRKVEKAAGGRPIDKPDRGRAGIVSIADHDIEDRLVALLYREKRCMSLREISRSLGCDPSRIRKPLKRLQDNGMVGCIIHKRRHLFHHSDYRFFPRYGITGRVLVARQQVGKAKIEKVARRCMRGGFLRKAEVLESLDIEYYPFWRFRVVASRKGLWDKLANVLVGKELAATDYLYMDPSTGKILVFDHNQFVLTDEVPDHPLTIKDLDQVAEVEERLPQELPIDTGLLSNLRDNEQCRKALAAMFPHASICPPRPLFFPVWVAGIMTREGDSRRKVLIDGIVGREIKGIGPGITDRDGRKKRTQPQQ